MTVAEEVFGSSLAGDTERPVLRAEGLHGGYGKKEVLRGLTIQIRKGEIVVLIGPNDAGKSTLLKAVAGLLRLSSGRVILGDRDITQLSTHRRSREGLSYLMQGGPIFPSLSVADHRTLGTMYGSRGVEWSLPSTVQARGVPAGFFSGGERHSLAIATVLAKRPELLLCDEPSAGLAPAVAKATFRRITEFARENSIPVLCWVEQRVGDALPLVDRAILLREGRVSAETRRPTEWMSAQTLAELTFGGGLK